MKRFAFTIALLVATTRVLAVDTFTVGDKDFLLNNQPFQIKCGEMHFSRVPREAWSSRLKMIRAMGLNTVCAYLFWNANEPQPGQFDFTGQQDVAEFCREAQQADLKVILRPGPYACAEWDNGGLPYWLLKDPKLKIRSRYPGYFEPAKRYLHEVGKQLAPLQITHGGPIVMVQVENEYGYFGTDSQYIAETAQAIKDAGFDVPLFNCDGPDLATKYDHGDLYVAFNFGSNPAENFAKRAKQNRRGPNMVSEYYPGWYDRWGEPHHTGDTAHLKSEIGWMLEHDASFSMYMVFGGTSFGFSAGANSRPFRPESTSYDYDAPIDEAGRPTKKFFELRELLSKHLSAGEKPTPEVPAMPPTIAFDAVKLEQVAPLFDNLPAPIATDVPTSFEQMDLPQGCVLYRTNIPAGPAMKLLLRDVHDYARIFLDGKSIGTIDRRFISKPIDLAASTQSRRLDVLIHAFGHINFGGDIGDQKGLGSASLIAADATPRVPRELVRGETALTNWQQFKMPLTEPELSNLKFQAGSSCDHPAFYKGTFKLDKPGDTFLDTRGGTLDFVWVNGHNLGRFWNIGPQQTLYCPAPYLKPGDNEIIVMDLGARTDVKVAGLSAPILDDVHDLMPTHRAPKTDIDLSKASPIFSGEIQQSEDAQTIHFDQPRHGRFLTIEADSSQDNDPFTAIAEVDLLDAQGQPLDRKSWRIVYADSEELSGEDGNADNAIDGDPQTFWHTLWQDSQPKHPHALSIDLGESTAASALLYRPRPRDGDHAPGRIKAVKIFLTDESLVKRVAS